MFKIRDTEEIKAHFMFNNFYVENRAVFEIIWKSGVDSDRSQKKIWRIRIAYYIPKGTNTFSEYLVWFAFLPQQ
jgi:hypothetical protein